MASMLELHSRENCRQRARHVLTTTILTSGICCRGRDSADSVSKAVLPVMREQKFGHIVTQSPPIAATVEAGMHGKVGYSMSKLGMTICAVGIAQEYAEYNVTANSIWPYVLLLPPHCFVRLTRLRRPSPNATAC